MSDTFTPEPPTWIARLVHLNACPEAITWAATYPTLEAAWAACPHAHWMLWWAAHHIGTVGTPAHRQLVLCACACARTILPYITLGEDRTRRDIATTEQWARGERGMTLIMVRTARASAWATGAWPAWAAFAGADEPTWVSMAASAWAWAPDAKAAHRHLADLVRTYYPQPPQRI